MAKKATRIGEMKNIHYCFKWLYYLLFFTGCSSFWLRENDFHISWYTKLYSNLIRLLVLLGFIGGFATKLTNEETSKAMLDHLPPILKFVMSFECFTCVVTYIQVIVGMERQRQAHINLAKQYQKLDTNFQREFPQIQWNYNKTTRKYSTLTWITLIYYCIVAMIYVFNLMRCDCNILMTIIIATSYSLITLSPGVVSFLQVGSVDILRLRYSLISRLIRETANAKGKKSSYKALQRLSLYCRRYNELIIDINNVFGYVVAVGLFYDFGILTNMFYLICFKVLEATAPMQEYIFIFLFILPRLYKVITPPIYGKMLETARRRCLHDICHQAEDSSFLHWKMLNSYDVTIGKVMRCNLYIIFMVFNGIANYVLVLIQLQFQQNNITHRLRNQLNWRRSIEIVDVSKL